nr:ATP-binding protein [uncultured Fluviicola sp.]
MLNKSAITSVAIWDQLFLFLSEIVHYRMKTVQSEEEIEFPDITSFLSEESLSKIPAQGVLTEIDLVALTLSLSPYMLPELIPDLLSVYLPQGKECPEMGLVRAKDRELFFPTGDTLLYLLAGKKLESRMYFLKYFQLESGLFNSGILSFGEGSAFEPRMSGRLIIDEEYVDIITTGEVQKPRMGAGFPAQLIETSLEWENLVLQKKTLDQILEIQSWLKHRDQLMNGWGLSGKIKPGYRVLFYGAPGTGKTLTATLLGKYTGRDVYRIDLSLVVSKYIGETEKNLSRLFDKAANKEWILFFDEADAVFGKRTSVKDSHDKYANQEVSYLLQRIENHPGLVILASNLKSNLDTAFTRRFQSMIEYDMPGATERLLLWKDILPENLALQEDISIEQISRTYNLSGANIVNVVQFACLKTAEEGSNEISRSNLIEGIRKEYVKEGKMFA